MYHDRQETESLECPQRETAGIDWFRTIIEDRQQVAAARDMAERVHDGDRGNGEKVGPWSWRGFEGRMSPRLRYGELRGKLLLESSGKWASDMWVPMLSFGGRTTRIDLQVTAEYSKPVPSFGTRCMRLEEMTHHHLQPSPRVVGLSTQSRGLWCGTVGRRMRPKYWRLYDKGVEDRSAAPGKKWRLELEAKYDYARALTEDIRCQQADPRWLYKRCVSLWRSAGFYWPSNDAGEPLGAVLEPEPPEPTLHQTFDWLERSVKPVVSRLSTVSSTNEMLRALGLETRAVDRATHDDHVRRSRVLLTRGAGMASDVQVAYQGAVGTHAAGSDRGRSAAGEPQ